MKITSKDVSTSTQNPKNLPKRLGILTIDSHGALLPSYSPNFPRSRENSTKVLLSVDQSPRMNYLNGLTRHI